MGEMTVEELEAGVEEGEAEVRRLSGEKVGGEGGLLRGGVK